MATEVERNKPLPKHEAFVDKQLDQVKRRIRTLDVGTYLLWFFVVTLGYGLIVALFDRAFGLEAGGSWGAVRVGAFLLYLAVAIYLLAAAGVCLYRRINPYYAAKKLEESVRDAKNSVVNWLDLRDEKLPAVIRQSLGQKAARDLNNADPEKAVAGSKAVLLVAVVAGLVLAAMVLFIMGPHQFGSLMQRAFLPFRDVSLATRTDITLLQPKEGNVVVGLNTSVQVKVQIDGRVPKVTQPDAARLHYRYNEADPFVSQVLEPAADGIWATTLLGDQIQSGLWYKITAGDAETPVYQVQVRTFPAVLRWEIKYNHRPYLKHLDFRVNFPNANAVLPRIRAYPGTEVLITAFTNRKVQSGTLKLTTDKATIDFHGETVEAEHTALRFKFPLERIGTFQVAFTSIDNEANTDQTAFPIDIIPDGAPMVVLTKPGKDVELAANDLLELEGHADDDLGLKALTLRMKVIEGEQIPFLQPKAYREGKSFRFDSGAFPTHLDYKDAVPLDALKTADGMAFPAKPGMVIEYWLEGTDNSDYPSKEGNLGRSESFKVKIREPEKDTKQQQTKRKQAEQEQKEHEKKQDQQLDKQNKESKQDKQPNQGKQDGKADPKNSPDPKDQELKKQEDKIEDLAKRAQEQLDKERQKGEAKPADEPKGENKDSKDKGDKQPGKAKDDPKGKEKASDPKDAGKQGKEQPGAEAKNGGQKGEGKPDPKAGPEGKKGEQKADGKPEPKGESKPGDKTPDASQAQAKDAKGPKEAPKGDNKGADPKQTPDAGQARSDEKSPSKAGEPKADDPKGKERPATLDEIAKLEKDAKQTDKKGEEALNELRKLSRDAADPKVRDAAEKAIENAGKANGPAEVKDKGGQEATAQAKPGPQPDPKQSSEKPAEAKGGTPDKTANADSKSAEKGPPPDVKPGEDKNSQFGGTKQSPQRAADDPKGVDADPALANRGGNLQLEELKKKMTPEMLKKAGISDAEWQQWLKDVQAYEKMLKDRGLTPDMRATGNRLPSTAPRQVNTKANPNEDPLQNVQAVAPPELREAYRLFTDPGAPKKK